MQERAVAEFVAGAEAVPAYGELPARLTPLERRGQAGPARRLLARSRRPLLVQGSAIARPGAPWPAVDPAILTRRAASVTRGAPRLRAVARDGRRA
ncbi:MAG: hypothetical protein M0Z49_08810 [Chloroflexi bacterium]|nr:hypothetical protein [Chloroflexota bacterium]